MSQSEIPELMRTIIAAGFDVTSVERKPNYLVLDLNRIDEFGILNKYMLAYAGDTAISSADVEGLRKAADHRRAALVLVTSRADGADDLAVVNKARFFGKLGGIVSSVLPLEPDYGTRLITLS